MQFYHSFMKIFNFTKKTQANVPYVLILNHHLFFAEIRQDGQVIWPTKPFIWWRCKVTTWPNSLRFLDTFVNRVLFLHSFPRKNQFCLTQRFAAHFAGPGIHTGASHVTTTSGSTSDFLQLVVRSGRGEFLSFNNVSEPKIITKAGTDL